MRWVTFATVGSGVLAYVVVLIAATTLSADRFTAFIVLWSLCFAVFASLQGFMRTAAASVRRAGAQQGRPIIDANANGIDDAEELVISSGPLGLTVIEDRTAAEILAGRERMARAPSPTSPSEPGARPITAALWAGALVAALAAAASPLWAPVLLVGMLQPLATLLFAVSAGLVVLQAALAGLLSGTGRWQTFGWLISAEAAARLLVVIVAALFGDIVAGLMYAAIAGAVITPVMLFVTPAGRDCRKLRSDLPMPQFLLAALAATAQSAVPSALIAGAPALLRLLQPTVEPLVLGNLMLALTMVRGAVLTPVTSFQNALTAHFQERLHRGMRALVAPTVWAVALGVPASLLLWFLGPMALQLIGPTYSLSGDVILQLSLGAVATSVLYITSAAVRAHHNHRADFAGWLVALITTAAVLLLVTDPVTATTAALLIGPLAGIATQLATGVREPVTPAPPEPSPSPEPVKYLSH
ncbi:hypothetical protein [uncultured Gulosibacter sp.]|uniref:hypothetical protein n=1 Tax=uncultured Gulosibacter sp. TaxID=1339167 RepID=UPI002889EB71|nr:hypothetical protein [uncultured Gulosibacter sp.]